MEEMEIWMVEVLLVFEFMARGATQQCVLHGAAVGLSLSPLFEADQFPRLERDMDATRSDFPKVV